MHWVQTIYSILRFVRPQPGSYVSHLGEEMVLKSAEQVIREQSTYGPDYIFENADYGRTPRGKVILAAVEGSRIPESLRGRPAECTKESAVTIVSAGHMSSFIYLYISLYLAVYSLMV